MVKHQGQVRFRKMNGGTQVSVNMLYTPPAGAVGHAVASLFGKDPKAEMDDDLARMKGLLEQGRTTAGGRKVNRDEVMGGKQQQRREDRERRAEREEREGRTGVPVTGAEHTGREMEEDFREDISQEPDTTDDDITQNIRRDMGGGEENTPGGQPRS